MTLTPREHQALRPLAPTREVYGKPPLPIEILAAGGVQLLAKYEFNRLRAEYLKTLGTTPKRRQVKS